MGTTHQGNVPSPLRYGRALPSPYVMKVLDKRDKERCDYSFEMLMKLVLMAVSAKSENILAVSQWVEDHQESLFALGFRNRRGERQLPSQATLYRFFWALEERIVELEHHLHRWACCVLEEVRVSGEMVSIGVDGKQVKSSKRQRQGEKAKQLLSCFVQGVGLSLKQTAVKGTEAGAAQRLLSSLEVLENLPWLFTGDAAFAERPVVEAILDKRGMVLFDLKNNLSDVKAYAEWAFSLPTCEQDSVYEDSEVRSGELWLRDIETRPATPEMTNYFPAAKQFIRCIRTVVNKATGEIRFKEIEYGLTSAYASASELYKWWRGHWRIENCSHNKRDFSVAPRRSRPVWKEWVCQEDCVNGR